MRHQTTSPHLKSCAATAAHRDYTGHIVISCLAVIAFAMFMGWYSKTSQPNTTLKTTSSISNPQSSVMEGLTEQTELLKAKRDVMALPVAGPPHRKKKWAQ